ncbi:MAG: hypothetical protein SFT68_02465 [Rickettsiaceae bacterium]|nr:hypothetical protein [Rickettsiaceae bacterium]
MKNLAILLASSIMMLASVSFATTDTSSTNENPAPSTTEGTAPASETPDVKTTDMKKETKPEVKK